MSIKLGKKGGKASPPGGLARPSASSVGEGPVDPAAFICETASPRAPPVFRFRVSLAASVDSVVSGSTLALLS